MKGLASDGAPTGPAADAPSLPHPTVPSWALLVAGVIVLALSGMRWNIAALAWVAPVPFLLYLRREERRGRWMLLAALMVSLNLQVMKIVTEPLPLVAAFAYGVPIGLKPLTFENRYVWLDEGGRVLETYDKHHPVPGEGSVPGTAPLRALARPYATTAGAICYDYDFPGMALGHAAVGVGLVAVPASDWRGIDPYHGQMARVRAIEGGFSILRPARAATSWAFDAYGRVRASLPFFEENDRVMLATLPTERVPTLYASIGDLPALVYVFVLAAAGVAAWRRTHLSSTHRR